MNVYNVIREDWKPIDIGTGYTNETRLEVSTHGRTKTFNRLNPNGKIVRGSNVNGYPIVRLKLFKPRSEEAIALLAPTQAKFLADAKRVIELEKTLAATDKASPEFATLTQELEEAKKTAKKSRQVHNANMHKDIKSRTVYFAALIHRMVAESFLQRPSPDHTIVAHLDYDKMNNKITNLKWMTPEENMAHQQLSPKVIADKDQRFRTGSETTDNRSKLTITKVMFLKKLLNEGKPIASLAKQFKITETQVIRIKKSENWKYVEAAK